MKARKFIECTIDLSDPVRELGAAINVVLGSYSKEQQIEILTALKQDIDKALDEQGKE
ncbi:hypothetical protein [Paenibacillus illinoisensis]|uniref:hypothetical protein n=1 Tax=Paenibacillus illinoisensis TaxID=59845 RepID=UPI002041798A|nr:hypothetical protein [Paenibacillus illinoisensis]MCM3208483.1 hypothetical protein [Paenibacillus illinoisensis]